MAQGVKKKRREREEKAATIAEVMKEKTKRLNVEIPKSRHNALKKLAVDRDKTIAELVNAWIEDGLSK